MNRWWMLATLSSYLCCANLVAAKPINYCPAVNLPPVIVHALVGLESQHNPFALGAVIDGLHVSFYPDTLTDAKLILRELLKRTTNVGIGLMQVSYHWHIRNTDVNPEHFFDPVFNREWGCRLLAQALDESETIWEGLGRYHSRTPKLKRTYALQVLRAARKANP